MALSKYDIELDLERQIGTSHAFLVELTGCNKRVLDVGCDTGYLGEALTAFGNKVWGFEISEEAANLARLRLIDCAVGDLERTDLSEVFEPNSFDVVIFGDVLEHLRDPLPVLQSVRRLVAAGGSVLISTPNIAHGDVRLALLKGQFRYNKLGILDETHTRFFTAESLVQFAHEAGFVIAELRRTRADLFSTEIGVVETDFDAALVEALRADPEATTYQFVARLVPDDAIQVTSEQALLIDGLNNRVDQLTRDLSQAQTDLTELRHAEQRWQAMIDEIRSAHDEAVRQRDVLKSERDGIRAQLDRGAMRRVAGRVRRWRSRASGS
jgi:2-polyprenyl-3-methyl-5-hydroxy-6-metoxy-1,4-benzoquinol methylase